MQQSLNGLNEKEFQGPEVGRELTETELAAISAGQDMSSFPALGSAPAGFANNAAAAQGLSGLGSVPGLGSLLGMLGGVESLVHLFKTKRSPGPSFERRARASFRLSDCCIREAAFA